jgi:hypothetical protein
MYLNPELNFKQWEVLDGGRGGPVTPRELINW